MGRGDLGMLHAAALHVPLASRPHKPSAGSHSGSPGSQVLYVYVTVAASLAAM